MATASTTFKSLLSMLSLGAIRTQPKPAVRRTAEIAAAQIIDEEQAFIASIADLTPEEQTKRVERRDWYKRLAQRQAIADVEYRAAQYLGNSGLR